MGCHRSKSARPVKKKTSRRAVVFAVAAGLTALVFASVGASARTRPVLVDSISIQGDSLFVAFQAPGLFDNAVLTALRRGATSAIEYEMRLWRDRKVLPDVLISTRRWRIRVVFDHLEGKYRLFETDSSAGKLVNLSETIGYCEHRSHEFVFQPVSGLKAGWYFVTVSVVVEPLALENYAELKRWLSGEAKNLALGLRKREKVSKEHGRFFQILLDLTGFGDRVRGGQSQLFRVNMGRQTGK